MITDKFVNSMPISNRIYGGKNASIEDFPYQVSLQTTEARDGVLCSGIIISKYYVLTTASCVEEEDYMKDNVLIRSGSSYWNKGGNIHYIENVFAHEKYEMLEYFPINDIALIKVTKPFEYNEKTKPIKLFEKSEKLKVGDMAVISGWGYGGAAPEDKFPENLVETTVPVFECDVPEGIFCAAFIDDDDSEEVKGAFIQDYGGPVSFNGRLAGIISGFEVVNTEISYFREWIDKYAEFDY